MLFASFVHFQKSDFEVEILYSFTIEDTAKLIRQIGDKARSQSVVWNKMEWPKRKWLTNESSAVSQKSRSLKKPKAIGLNPKLRNSCWAFQ